MNTYSFRKDLLAVQEELLRDQRKTLRDFPIMHIT